MDQDYAAASDIGDDETHILDYARVLYRRRWLALTVFLVVALSVIVYSFTVTPVYQARVKLLIESATPNFVDFQQVVEDRQAQATYYQTQYDILKSRALARKTLEARQLWTHPEFAGTDEADRSFSVRRTLRRSVSAAVSWVAGLVGSADATVPGVADDDESAAQSNIINAFLGRLQVLPVRNSRIVDVTFRSPDPRLATDVVNALALAYIDQNLEFKYSQSIEASDWLADRLAEQRQQVEQSETALQRYREDNDAVSLDERQNIVVQKLADVNSAVTAARTERIEKEARYDQLRAIQDDREALDTFPAILSNGFIQQQKGELAVLQRERAQLAENLGDRHPDMISILLAIQNAETRIEGEIANVVRSVRTEFLTAQAQEQSLVDMLDAQEGEALALDRKGIDYGALLREAESNRQLYESLLQQAKETGVSGELRTSNIRVVDAAELPNSPVNRSSTYGLIGIFGGMFMAVGLVFFLEYLDNRISTPDEIKLHLGLPVLGMVPVIPPKVLGTTSPLVTNGVPVNFVEAFNAVRTSLLFSSAEEGTRKIAVTSTGPGEGKSVVASNLAVGLGQTGQRVLLIDADLRRPSIHTMFGQQVGLGLSDLLVGKAKASDAIRRSTAYGLWVLTSGTTPPNPVALLGSQRFKDILAGLDDHFDWVVIDTPPVMAVTDATIVAHEVPGVVFVVGAEQTSRHAAQTALERLQQASGRCFGVVLNRVDLERNPYFYSRYYRREYAEYYATSRS
jgi:capsular exopolysaccharide synthesis family protein